ncbi:hypothetical protein SPLC1_S060940 [Arthrospira platensis C1]|nr:hypothetical protein SPLC1_S060940 [Arthrospira platensis C1]
MGCIDYNPVRTKWQAKTIFNVAVFRNQILAIDLA